jgi:adenine-specific DNA-methyltransferase
MQSEIYDTIATLAEDVKDKLPDSFKNKYYEKMSYSGESRIESLEEELINKTISFEIAFSHIIIYLFNMQFCVNSNYIILLKKLEVDGIFSWYQMDKDFIKSNLSSIHLNGFSEAYNLINQHDTFIGKDVKKTLGQFYTPSNIVKRMVLDLKPSIKILKSKDLIIDPACGTGVFLIEIIEQLKNIFTPKELINYVSTNIFAYDINPFAVVVTKLNVIYTLIKNFPDMEKEILRLVTTRNALGNIKWKNTITEMERNLYKIILGNPPYFKLNNKLIKNIEGYDEILYGQPNIYSFFMYWAMQHLQQDGTMSFIVPQSIRSGLYFKKLRASMKNLQVRSIIHIDSRQNVFDRAEQAVLIICLENKPIANSKTKIQFFDATGKVNTQFKVSRSKLMMDEKNNHVFIISKKIEMYTILEKVLLNSTTLDDEISEVKFSNGLFVWNQHKQALVDQDQKAIPIIYGGHVQPLVFNFSPCSSNVERKQYAKVSEKTNTYVLSGKRLLIQRTTNFEKDIRLKACLIPDDFLKDYSEYFLENHINFLCSTKSKNEILSLQTMYYYLGVLNSKLLNYIFSSKSGNTQVSANELNALPYPHKGSETISQFVSIHLEDLGNHLDELDSLVCTAYGLSEEEAGFILNY